MYLVSSLKLNSRNKGTFIIKGLLGNLEDSGSEVKGLGVDSFHGSKGLRVYAV